MAMALNLASFHRPALAIADIRRIQPVIRQADPMFRAWDIRESSVPGPDARRDFVHFWFYPLLAVPAVWITQFIGVTPIVAFIALNLALLGIAFWVALPRIGAAASLLLFAGPIVWWMDKPHTESFTFALLILAVVLMPGWRNWCARQRP